MDLKLGTEGFDVQCKKCGKVHYAKSFRSAFRQAEDCRCKNKQIKKKRRGQ